MAYDDHQWALLPLLLASMLVFLLLVATMFLDFRYRVGVYIGMMLYFHQDGAKNTGELIISMPDSALYMASEEIKCSFFADLIQKHSKCKRFMACS